MDRPPTVFISAAEPSADQHAAGLIRAARTMDPSLRFVGVAGPHMRDAGCEAIFDLTAHSAMLLSAVRLVGRAMAMYRQCQARFRAEPPDAVVLVDSPALHLRLARMARQAGAPVLYYIAPQLWAWGAGRIRKLRRDVDELAVILPFEEKYFGDRGVRATFVGHPLAEQLRHRRVDEATVAGLRGRGRPFVALLPGSRRHVVKEVLPGQVEVARAIAERFPEAAFGISVAHPGIEELARRIAQSGPQRMLIGTASFAELIEAADLVLVASGTATLDVAMRGRAMIVMYNASRLMYHLIGRWVVRTPHLSLPNIIAGRRIVPEFMPYYRSTEPIAREAVALLADDAARQRMIDDLAKATAGLREGDASARTAELLLGLISRRRDQLVTAGNAGGE